jgi:hypothetical protein
MEPRPVKGSLFAAAGANTIDVSGSTILGPLEPTRLGQSAHELIYLGHRRGLHNPSGEELLELWKELGIGEPQPIYWLAERQVAVSRADTYFNVLPTLTQASLLATELPLAETSTGAGPRADAAFETSGNGVFLEEYKTGRLEITLAVTLDSQLERLRLAAIKRWGDRFLGIRACLLMAPARSFWVYSDGTRHHLLDPPWGVNQ